MDHHPIDTRKSAHIDICLNGDSKFDRRTTGFEDFWFLHQALPEIDLDDIDLSTQIFNKQLTVKITHPTSSSFIDNHYD